MVLNPDKIFFQIQKSFFDTSDMAAQPLQFGELLNLPSLGIGNEYIKFGTTSMESDKFICVCEQINGAPSVAIIDMANGNSLQKRPISAEAAIMNPVSKVIALRAGNQLQIFNMELRAKMKSHQMKDTVVFWRWISPNMIGMVTNTAVFHWSIEGDSSPVKMFDRHANLTDGTQIISYQTSDDGNWFLLVGISAGEGGKIAGTMQLYSKEKKVSQVLQGHSGAFATITPPGRTDPGQVLCFAGSKGGGPQQLFVMEVGRDKDAAGGPAFRLSPQNIPFAADAANDFPVSMQITPKEDIIFMITKMGYLFLFDVHSGKALCRLRVCQDTVFVTCVHTASNGMLGITRKGQVMQFSINKATLVPYIVQTLRDSQLALSLANRLDLPGAEELYFTEFDRLMSGNDIQGAARLAASSPQGVLRTPQTIQRFQQLPAQAGQPQPVLQYFSVLLEKGTLNKNESLELARPVLQQGRGQLLEKWLKEDKLECSEELGDMVAQSDTNMALSVYLRAEVPEKVINCFVQRGEFDKIVAYASKTSYRCDYSFMLQNLVRTNPQAARDFAQKLATAENGPLVDIASVVDIFMQVNRIQETTEFLLEALKSNRPEEGFLQTRLLEINLLGGSPQVADAILSNKMFSHYDRPRVAQLCEKAGLFQRGLEHYTEMEDLKRCVVNTQGINPEFLITFFGQLTTDQSLLLLDTLLSNNLRQNLNVVVQIATKYADQIGASTLVDVFEKYKSYDGLYYFLGAVVNVNEEPEVHFKYIEAATKMGQFKEVERVCRDSTVYDPVKVKEFLMDAKLQDPRPLIHVCDRYDHVEELTQYLYSNNLLKYIEVYATKVSPQKTPQVIGKLLDLDCNEDYIKTLLGTIPQCPVEELVDEVEKRNRLRLLQPYLENRLAQGSTETATHNAIGKIYITLNREPQKFLTTNEYYDSAVVGKYCEKLDPSLAYLAYRRAGGPCDEDLLRVTKENGLYKDLARYLVERQDLDLWASALKCDVGEEEAPTRRSLIDQVVQTALPESKNPDEVSITVKAFMNADLPDELIELLERIVLQGSDFSANRNLQNLLILTAIKSGTERVMDYVNRLDNFDGPDIARIAVGEQYQLFEEAFVIYKKTEHYVDAIGVLLDHLNDMQRAYEYADLCNMPEVWSRLAQSQLDNGLVMESMESFIKAGDPVSYTNVIEAAERDGRYEDMIPFLKMSRRTVKEQQLDTALIYAYAKCEKYGDLEEFISSPNVAQIQIIGERCYDEKMYEAAKLLFANINNNAKLAICFVRLGNFREAVDAATRANSVGTWKEVNMACVEVGEFRLASLCGLHIIVHPDHLEALILHYERRGYWKQLLKLLEQGLGLEGAHAGVFTELGVLYSKYLPEKLMEHIKIFHGRMNMSKILRACEKALHWDEAVYLYKEDGQFDNAVRTMVEHPLAFHHDLFLDCIQKVRNQEVHYKAINFYLEQHPLELTRLLQVLTPNLDHARVVHQLRKSDNLPLVVEYLKDVQKENLSAVNEALNEIYVDDEDYTSLRDSVDHYDNFDQISLSHKIEKHELLEFRRIAAYVYQQNKRFAQSIKLSKGDKMYKDAIDCAAASEDPELAEELLRFFVSVQDKECFCGTLFTCYDLIKPDAAMELAWRNGYTDFVMPYMIQFVKNTNEQIKELQQRTAPPDTSEQQPPPGMDQQYMGGAGMQPVMQLANAAYNGSNDPQYMSQQNQMGGMQQQQQNQMGMQQPNMGGMQQQQYGGYQY